MTPAEAAEAVKVQVQTDKERIEQQVIARYPRASNALRNVALSVLANPSPSPPGSPPGVRSGNLRRNWNMSGGAVCITSGMGYAFCRQDTADCIAEYHGYICRDRRLTC